MGGCSIFGKHFFEGRSEGLYDMVEDDKAKIDPTATVYTHPSAFWARLSSRRQGHTGTNKPLPCEMIVVKQLGSSKEFFPWSMLRYTLLLLITTEKAF